MRRFFQFILQLAREISDEAAYLRYVAAKGVRPSSEEWRLFSDSRMREKYHRAKCC